MKIDEKSWHFRYYNFVKKNQIFGFSFNDLNAPKIDLCSYVKTILISPILLMHYVFTIIFGIGFLIACLIAAYNSPLGFAVWVGLMISVCAISAGIVIFFSTIKRMFYIRKYRTKTKPDNKFLNLLRMRYRAYKKKICPLIEIDRSKTN